MKRTSEPFGYSRPDFIQITGLTSSVSNSVKLEFAGHPPVQIAPTWKMNTQWQAVSPHLPHPITARSQHQYDCRIFPEQNLAYFQFNACRFDKTATFSMACTW